MLNCSDYHQLSAAAGICAMTHALRGYDYLVATEMLSRGAVMAHARTA